MPAHTETNEGSVGVQENQDSSSLGSLVQKQAERWAPALRMTILLAISLVATLVRVFSVNKILYFAF